MVAILTAGVLAGGGTADAAAGPPVTLSPAPANGGYQDQQVVKVSVGGNSTFTPNSRVVILQCADPGGSVANLPTSLSSCDENTIQPDTTVVRSDGSFSEPAYTIYALPSTLLGEQANWQPTCGPGKPCVLFVGENQNDFSQAKAFSAPFEVKGSAGAPVSAPASGQAGTPAAAPVAVSAAVSLAPTQLAFTGSSDWIVRLAGAGLVLIALATAVASLLRRSPR